MLVGGDVESDNPVRYAESIGAFAFAWAWDQRLMSGHPLIQAQAVGLDDEAEDLLRATYVAGLTTYGWPCNRNLRFEGGDDFHLLLWACDGQCDWWLSGPSLNVLEPNVAALLDVSNLRSFLWSNDDAGEDLLDRLRRMSR